MRQYLDCMKLSNKTMLHGFHVAGRRDQDFGRGSKSLLGMCGMYILYKNTALFLFNMPIAYCEYVCYTVVN